MESAAPLPGSSVARWTLIASILGSSMAFIDGSVVNVALPSIQADLGGGLATQQWVVDAYLLTLGSLILVGGSLGDIFGESKVFALGVASFAAVSVLCAIAPDAPMLIVFRGLQGMAGALLVPASLAMITATFTGAARGNAIGQWTAWTGISFIIGPTLGGWLVDVSTWRVIFLINIPIALVTLLILARLGGWHQARREDLRVDVPGAILCTAGLGLLVAGFIEQPQRGWGDPLILGAFIGGAACLGAFVAYELRTPMPMLPLRLFRLRNFSVTNVETLSVYGGLSGPDHVPDALPDRVRRLLGAAGGHLAAAGHGRHVLPLAAHGAALDAVRAEALHGARAGPRGPRRARLYAPAAGRDLLGGRPAGAARLLARPVADRRPADDDRARRRAGRGRRSGVGREQRGRPHRGSPRDRDPRDLWPRAAATTSPSTASTDDGRRLRAARLRRPDRRDRDPQPAASA